MIAGTESPDNGTISFHTKNPKIGYMRQEIPGEQDIGILEYLRRDLGFLEMDQELDRLQLALDQDDNMERF